LLAASKLGSALLQGLLGLFPLGDVLYRHQEMQFSIAGKSGKVIIEPGILSEDRSQVALGALFLSGNQGGLGLIEQPVLFPAFQLAKVQLQHRFHRCPGNAGNRRVGDDTRTIRPAGEDAQGGCLDHLLV